MAYVIGMVVSVIAFAFVKLAGLDRDRAAYPLILVVTASYYVLFAVMGGSTRALVEECLAMTVFAVAAVMGFRTSLWIVVAALAGHGVFDLVRGHLIVNTGVPEYWPAFCLAFDIGLAALLAVSLRSANRSTG